MSIYKEDKNTRGRIWGAVWAAAYLALWLILMFIVKFPAKDISVVNMGQGMMINFGDVDEAGGDEDTQMSEDFSTQSNPAPAQPQQPVETRNSDYGDIPAPQRQERPQPTTQPQPVERPRTVDSRTLFPGRTAGSTSTSEGTGQGTGNQGNPAGSPTGSHDGTGTGTSGTSFNLAGRSPMGTLPKPAYNSDREGRVVVEITVNAEGRVTNATYRATGSTGVDTRMINDALEAARKARFTASESELQSGTITYVFRMN